MQHPRFERETADDCLACHAGDVNRPAEKSTGYGSPAFSEMSIGCERCHGPGGAHVTWHESRSRDKPDETSAPVPDPIVNPAKLEAARREDVCNQCHLHGKSRQLRFGRTTFDFRPGMKLDDVWLIFVNGDRVPSDDREREVSHSEQMRHSACFRQSDGRFGCVSCHAPHSVPPLTERTKFYQERCLKCHTDAGCTVPEVERNTSPSHGSCLACHMPRRDAHDSPHTPRTDHRILRRPDQPTPDQPRNIPVVEDSLLLWNVSDNAEPRVPDWEIRRARGLMLAGLAEKIGPSPFAAKGLLLLEPIEEALPDDLEIQEWLGICESLTGREALAKARWTRASTKALHRESILKRLAFLAHGRQDWKAAAEYFDRLVEINPWRSDFHSRNAQVREALGDSDRAAESARRAIELNPTLSQAHELLARTYQLKGQLELSGKHRERAETLRKAGF